MLHDMFALQLPLLEKIIRTSIVYVALLTLLRLAGKRELAQLNPFDLIVLLMLSNTVQNAIIGNDNSVSGGLIGAATLLILNYLVVRFLRRFKRLDRLVEGHADVLMRDGKIMRDHLDRELITRAELVAAAHKQGITSLHDVDRCVLEPTGTITFITKKPTTETSRHEEILEQLRRITTELAALRGSGPTENRG